MSKNLTAIIKSYKKFKASNPDTWKLHSKNQLNLVDAIMVASSSRNNLNKKHPHQYRLQNNTLDNQGKLLVGYLANIKSMTNFDSLYAFISKHRIQGVGDLTVYDIAVRIGYFLNLEPNSIYLHAGTRIGVNKLLKKSVSGSIKKSDLPSVLAQSNLSYYELEDLLCIYKNSF